MTSKQKEVVKMVETEGVALFNTTKHPQIVRCARVMMAYGYTYYWTGSHLAIARYGVCAKAAVMFANHRCQIRRFDKIDTPMLTNPAAKARHEEWFRAYLLKDQTFSAPTITPLDRMLISEVTEIERERKPTTPLSPAYHFVHQGAYMLNTKMHALTAIPVVKLPKV
jgi:hypothetical protein